MYKKLFCLLLAVLAVLSLSACFPEGESQPAEINAADYAPRWYETICPYKTTWGLRVGSGKTFLAPDNATVFTGTVRTDAYSQAEWYGDSLEALKRIPGMVSVEDATARLRPIPFLNLLTVEKFSTLPDGETQTCREMGEGQWGLDLYANNYSQPRLSASTVNGYDGFVLVYGYTDDQTVTAKVPAGVLLDVVFGTTVMPEEKLPDPVGITAERFSALVVKSLASYDVSQVLVDDAWQLMRVATLYCPECRTVTAMSPDGHFLGAVLHPDDVSDIP